MLDRNFNKLKGVDTWQGLKVDLQYSFSVFKWRRGHQFLAGGQLLTPEQTEPWLLAITQQGMQLLKKIKDAEIQ